MPQMPIHYYDCAACHTCWKLGRRLLPDPVRQILRDTGVSARVSTPAPGCPPSDPLTGA